MIRWIHYYLEKFFSNSDVGLIGMYIEKWRVNYSDGAHSTKMKKGNALEYMMIFDGNSVEKMTGWFRRTIKNPRRK